MGERLKDKWVQITLVNEGGSEIAMEIKGRTIDLKNPKKRKIIGANDVANLRIIFEKAFYEEFEGTEGMVEENRLTEGIEHPDEVARRTIASLATRGFTSAQIAECMLRTNSRVRRSIAPNTIEWKDREKSLESVIRSLWPSSK